MGGRNKTTDPRQQTVDRRLKTIVVWVSCLVSLVFCLSCATSFDRKGKYHTVRSGETLEWIAKGYRVSLQELAEINNVQKAKEIKIGQKLYLPERRYKNNRFKKLPIDALIAEEVG